MSEFIVVPKRELYHHGIKDQQWGHRNGPPYPLTTVGKEKFKKQKKEADRKEKQEEKGKKSAKETATAAFTRDIKTKNGKKSTVEDVANNTKSITRNVNDLYKQAKYGDKDQQKQKLRNEARTMSDQELQQKIQRMRLEQQYADLSHQNVTNGADKVERYMGMAVTGLEIVGSAVAIAAAVTTLKGNIAASKEAKKKG